MKSTVLYYTSTNRYSSTVIIIIKINNIKRKQKGLHKHYCIVLIGHTCVWFFWCIKQYNTKNCLLLKSLYLIKLHKNDYHLLYDIIVYYQNIIIMSYLDF